MAMAAIMYSPIDVAIATTAGHVINFKTNKPKFVPALAVRHCAARGARTLKQFKNTERPDVFIAGKRDVVKARMDQKDSEESKGPVPVADFKPSEIDKYLEEAESTVQAQQEKQTQKTGTGSAVFTEAETSIRAGITKLLDDGNPDNFVDFDGVPKVGALQGVVSSVKINKAIRDRVFAKMQKNGEIDEDQLASIFGISEEEDEEGEE